jgi:hypothetical protein
LPTSSGQKTKVLSFFRQSEIQTESHSIALFTLKELSEDGLFVEFDVLTSMVMKE